MGTSVRTRNLQSLGPGIPAGARDAKIQTHYLDTGGFSDGTRETNYIKDHVVEWEHQCALEIYNLWVPGFQLVQGMQKFRRIIWIQEVSQTELVKLIISKIM